MKIISIFQLIIAVLLIIVVMLQNRGVNNGMAFGGGSQTYRSKKGLEQFLFYTTIVLAAVFAATSILSVLI